MAAIRSRRKRQPAGFTTTPDAVKIGALLREAGFAACDDDPISCRASFDADGRPRSIKARYPGGWCCRLTMHKNGTYSLTQSISVRLRSGPKVA